MQALPHQRYKCKCKKVKWQNPKEEKPQAEIKRVDFLEMQKLMLETIERMINQKLENFRSMAIPKTQCMG